MFSRQEIQVDDFVLPERGSPDQQIALGALQQILSRLLHRTAAVFQASVFTDGDHFRAADDFHTPAQLLFEREFNASRKFTAFVVLQRGDDNGEPVALAGHGGQLSTNEVR